MYKGRKQSNGPNDKEIDVNAQVFTSKKWLRQTYMRQEKKEEEDSPVLRIT